MPDQLIPTIPALLEAIDDLPGGRRAERLAQLECVLDLREGQREMAIGLLALDLVTMDVT